MTRTLGQRHTMDTGGLRSEEGCDIKYKMDHPKRGTALIINQESFDDWRLETRRGTAKDGRDLEGALKDYGFDVDMQMDKTKKELLDRVREIANKDHRNVDCLLVTVMTHGRNGNGDELFARDCYYQFSMLWKAFSSTACPSLAGKPKIFLVQACRGERLSADTSVRFSCNQKETLERLPGEDYGTTFKVHDHTHKYADFVFLYGTIPNFVSYRDSVDGSYFIQAICRALNDAQKGIEFAQLASFVNKEVISSLSRHHKEQLPMMDYRLGKMLVLTKSIEPQSPEILNDLMDMPVVPGSTAMFELGMNGHPRPNMHWTKDGNIICENDTYQFLYPDQKTTILLIRNVTVDDMGTYQVKLSNKLGEVSSEKAKLINALQPKEEAPMIQSNLSDQLVVTGNNAFFEIKVRGHPKPDLHWTKDGKTIHENDHFQFIDCDTDTTILKVNMVTTDDVGMYQVILSNHHGKVSSKANLTLHDHTQHPLVNIDKSQVNQKVTNTNML